MQPPLKSKKVKEINKIDITAINSLPLNSIKKKRKKELQGGLMIAIRKQKKKKKDPEREKTNK